jgi:hypothetical protein
LYWIVVDVPDHGPQVPLVFAQPRIVPVLEYVSAEPQTPVEVDGEAPLDVVHDLRQGHRAAAAEQVDVVGQKRVREDPQSEPFDRLLEQREVEAVVLRRVEQTLLVVASCHHVVHAPWDVHPALASHSPLLLRFPTD